MSPARVQARASAERSSILLWAGRNAALNRYGSLRVATSYAQLLKADGRRSEALELLCSVYDWFTEGFHTKDLIEARVLLDGLR